MSSTAMSRGIPSYQARTGRTVEEHTRAMIIAAAQRLMTAGIATPDGALDRLTIAQVCAGAQGYVRRDGTEGPIPKATMWKHFKTIEALAAAVVENMTAEDRTVPAEIATLAARDRRADTRSENHDVKRLEARFSARHFDIPGLEGQYEAALVRDNRSDMVFWSAELAERHLQRHRRGDRQSLSSARDWARRGLGLVDPDSRLDAMMGIRCTRAATAAEAALARRADYEATALSRIRSLKETEAALADALGWDLHRELARFHAEHARALGEEDPEREMRAYATIADTLTGIYAADPPSTREPQDVLRAAELADIIVGLCRIDMAYATHPDHQGIYTTTFGDDIATTTRNLLACFPAAISERLRHEGNIRALLRLVDLTRHLDQQDSAADADHIASAIQDYGQASSDLLRTAEYGTIRDILVARFLTAKAHALSHSAAMPDDPSATIAAERPQDSLIRPDPAALLQGAIQFYEHAASTASPRGSTGILRSLAVTAGAELARSNLLADNVTTPASNEFDSTAIARAINDLVLIAVSRRNRFTDSEVEHLLNIVDPMYYYMTAGRN
ncbi:hypothetical protein ACL02S_01605 [Nocardia sp. 004]|uniref:hypothetical protein n=1 Tax=Nocardia sp. 004 TaxID=3385978 RepID=UPI0039A1637A